jgi:hypothetical protein
MPGRPLTRRGANLTSATRGIADERHPQPLVPLYLGAHRSWETVALGVLDHIALHRRMNAFFRDVDRGTHRSMAWSWINKGAVIRKDFSVQERIARLDAFHRTIARDPRWKEVVAEWRRMYPELHLREWRP